MTTARARPSDKPSARNSNTAALKTFSEKLERHSSNTGDPEPLPGPEHWSVAFRHPNSTNDALQATVSQRGFLFHRGTPPTVPLATSLLIGNAIGRSWKNCELKVELDDTLSGTTQHDLYRCGASRADKSSCVCVRE